MFNFKMIAILCVLYRCGFSAHLFRHIHRLLARCFVNRPNSSWVEGKIVMFFFFAQFLVCPVGFLFSSLYTFYILSLFVFVFVFVCLNVHVIPKPIELNWEHEKIE